MAKYTFTITQITGPYGNKYSLLTANEYPWMNCQVIPTPPDRKEEIMAELNKRQEYVVYADGRTDFCIIQAGGGTPEHPTIEINDDNWEEVDKALCDCMQTAAVIGKFEPSIFGKVKSAHFGKVKSAHRI